MADGNDMDNEMQKLKERQEIRTEMKSLVHQQEGGEKKLLDCTVTKKQVQDELRCNMEELKASRICLERLYQELMGLKKVYLIDSARVATQKLELQKIDVHIANIKLSLKLANRPTSSITGYNGNSVSELILQP